MKMNKTFLVGSLFDCSLEENHSQVLQYRSLWRQTRLGCRILAVIIDIFGFNVTYAIQNETFDVSAELLLYNNESVDIFTRPMSLRVDIIELAYPIHSLFDWNFGFTVYSPESLAYSWDFYSNPFSSKVWDCLFIVAVFCSGLLYFTKYWENRLVSGLMENSFGYEMLMIVGGYCQHVPPIDAVLYSRRAVYLTFFIFAYIIYTYYTSNLLSHLVNDKDGNIDVDMILNSGMEGVILEDQMWIIMNFVKALLRDSNDIIYNKLRNMKSVNITTGLEQLKTRDVALLSDYVSIDPFIHSVFENHELCGLKNIDVISDIKKYFYVSKGFPYKEEFKVAFLRMQEAGILARIFYEIYINDKIECGLLTHVQTSFRQILPPIYMLLGAYVLCLFILMMEIVHYKTTWVWPYVE